MISSSRRGCRLAGLLALLVSAALSQAQTGQLYSIQAGAYNSAQEAAAAQAELQAKCSPVSIQLKEGEKPYKVVVGRFSGYLDAWATKQKLKKNELPGAFLVPVSSGLEVTENTLPIDAPFSGPELADNGTSAAEYWDLGGFANDREPGADLQQAPPAILNRGELLEAGLSAAKHPWTGVQPLEEFLTRYADDPKADHARLRLARVYGRGSNPARAEVLLNKVLKDGTPAARAMARFISAHVKLNRGAKAEAYEAFRSIANDGTLPADLRRQAMWRTAAVAHSNQQYADAWLAFKHIEQHADTPKAVHEARVQLAGLMFENVTRSKCSWEEVRVMCRSVADDVQADRAERATAELMYLETFYEQKNYARSLALVNAFLATYGDVNREAYIANIWKGLSLYGLNREDEAKPALEQVALAEVAPQDKFGNSQPCARAAVWLVHIADKQRNPVERARWIDFLNQQYPDSPETRAIPQILIKNQS